MLSFSTALHDYTTQNSSTLANNATKPSKTPPGRVLTTPVMKKRHKLTRGSSRPPSTLISGTDPDSEPFAVAVGTTSIIIVILFAVCIVITDVSAIVRDIKKMRRNVRSFIKYYRGRWSHKN